MEELMTIQMTPKEYKEYRGYQTTIESINELIKQKDDMIGSLRDQYYQEFTQRQEWSKRTMIAEKKLEKLLEVIHSSMPAKIKLEVLISEIEQMSIQEQTSEKQRRNKR